MVFEHLSHINSLAFLTKEADELFSWVSLNEEWATWEFFKESWKLISNGNIGVFVQGLAMLQWMSNETPRRPWSEDQALNQLRGPCIFPYFNDVSLVLIGLN